MYVLHCLVGKNLSGRLKIYKHTCIDACVCVFAPGQKGSALLSALYDNKAKAVPNCEMWRSITLDKNVPNQCGCHASRLIQTPLETSNIHVETSLPFNYHHRMILLETYFPSCLKMNFRKVKSRDL
ncbi:hypothetical protein T02_3660 [Trichinella nativa]|uniref:Uncharacterized protein n=1 Tax=Trichinella nativa TaxID=6335 RepID=A0A0V1L0A9_9BILA|nr:hypothetical protein T02_3660 [Trichinella nativa]